MQAYYQAAANELQETIKELVASFKTELLKQGLNKDVLLDQPIAVEIVAFALINCLAQERLAFNPFEDKLQAHQTALEMVRSAVIKYRGHNLIPLTEH
ncbi:MAG: hypothetical protein HC877_20340 [Thioploca sp.]|nr:hypothetical protein [Thioploca sp.]